MSASMSSSYWRLVVFYGLMLMVFVKPILVIFPIYYQYYQVSYCVENLVNQIYSEESTKESQFRESLAENFKRRKLNTELIDQMLTIHHEQNVLIVDIDYEERQHLMFNVDVVMSFSKHYQGGRQVISPNE